MSLYDTIKADKMAWYPGSVKKEQMSMNVTAIHFVAFSTSATEAFLPSGYKPTNHWAMFLELEGGSAIDLNMQPGGDAVTGCVVLNNRASAAYNDDEIKPVSSPVPGGTTVATILQMILDKKRERYRFTSAGEGCRYWCLTFAGDLNAAGLFTEDAYSTLAATLPKFWKTAADTTGEDRTMDQGTFF